MQTAQVVNEGTRSESDSELLLDSEPSDRRSFGILFDRHSRAVYATAFAIVQDAADAEELLSDAFLLLWRKRATIEFFGDSLLPWLMTTVRFLARNMRRATRPPVVPLDDQIGSAASAPVERAVELRLISEQLDGLIGSLSALDQEIVQLCLIDGLTYEQAAAQLGITHGTVRNRLSRSKKQLRAELDPEGLTR